MKTIYVSLLLIFSGILMFGAEQDNLVIQKSDNPVISIKIWFKTGWQDDPADKKGLSSITAQMLSEGGTKSLTYEKVLDFFFPLAADFSVSSSMEMTVVNARIHKDNLEEFYPVFIDHLLNPGFREEDLQRVKQNTLNYIKTTLRYSSDEELGKAVLYNEIFKNTPYENIGAGTVSSIESITIKDIQESFTRYFNRSNYVLGISGAADEKFIARIQSDLNKLSAGKVNSYPKITPDKINGLETVIVNKKAAATAISFGFPINLVRGSREWYALAIANSWLGEHRNSSSHLYQVIREKRGLNYGDYSYIENFPNGGRYQMPPANVSRRNQIFEIWIRPVPNETRHFSLRAAMRELQLLIDNGMSKEDFETTRKFLRNYVLHFAPSEDKQLAYALDDKFYGINGSHLQKFRQMMSEITLEEVNAAIKKHLQYNNMKIVFITENGEQLKDDLVKNTSSPIQYSSPKSADILEEDKLIIDYKLPFKSNSVKVVAVEELFK